jgi:hypothetical protein
VALDFSEAFRLALADAAAADDDAEEDEEDDEADAAGADAIYAARV